MRNILFAKSKHIPSYTSFLLVIDLNGKIHFSIQNHEKMKKFATAFFAALQRHKSSSLTKNIHFLYSMLRKQKQIHILKSEDELISSIVSAQLSSRVLAAR